MNWDDLEETLFDWAEERGMTREDAMHEYEAYARGNNTAYTARIRAIEKEMMEAINKSRIEYYESGN